LVEEFDYPGAADILKTKNVVLRKGDGHIPLIDCSTPASDSLGRIEVESSRMDGGPNRLCFSVKGQSAWLTMEVPIVYSIDARDAGTGTSATADLTTDDGKHTTVPLSPTNSTPVGSGKPGGEPTVLMELRVKPAQTPPA
jgi:hypothetical protein